MDTPGCVSEQAPAARLLARVQGVRRLLAGGRRHARPRVCILRQTDLYEPPVQRAAEALVAAGCDVEVILMENPDRPRSAQAPDHPGPAVGRAEI